MTRSVLPPRTVSDRRWLFASYALTPLLTLLAILCRLQFSNHHGHILLMMFVPVLMVAYRGGIGPGLLCTTASALVSDYFLIEPLYSFAIDHLQAELDWMLLIGAGVMVSVFSELALRTRRRTEAINVGLLDRILMLNQTFDVVFIWKWDGPITSWNAAAEWLYGFSEKDAVGRVSNDLLKTSVAGGMNRVMANLEKDGKWEGELCHTTRDGRLLTVKSRMLLVRETERSFVVEVNQDISDSKLAERELARVQNRFETAFRLSPLGKLVVRLADNSIVAVNDSYLKMIGTSREELTQQTLFDHDPLINRGLLSDIRASLEDGKIVTIAGVGVEFKRKNGEKGVGVLYAEVLEGAPDRHALLVLHDVTTRQRAEDKLKVANNDLQQFAYAAAHDLQEPVRNISTALGLFKRGYGKGLEEEGVQLIEDSIEAAKRMGQMIRDLLAFTRADHSVQELHASGTAALRHALQQLHGPIAESEAEIIAITDLPELQVQPTHLLQLLQNLIGNALKYRAPNVRPNIRIGAKLEGQVWTLSVADNGIGFDSDFSDQIFGVFKRLQPGSEYEGNGIGLAICERIVQLYKGRIWAESSPGEGATFFFTLPAAEVQVLVNSKTMKTSG